MNYVGNCPLEVWLILTRYVVSPPSHTLAHVVHHPQGDTITEKWTFSTRFWGAKSPLLYTLIANVMIFIKYPADLIDWFRYIKIITLVKIITFGANIILPSIAQLVERWTVEELKQISLGHWFESGSRDYFYTLYCTFYLWKRILDWWGKWLNVCILNIDKLDNLIILSLIFKYLWHLKCNIIR